MADPNVLAGQMLTNDQQTLAFVERHASDKRRQRLASYYAPPLPNAYTEPQRYAALQSELMAGLVEAVEGMVSQPATAKRGPGRPRKVSQDASMDRAAGEAVAAD